MNDESIKVPVTGTYFGPFVDHLMWTNPIEFQNIGMSIGLTCVQTAVIINSTIRLKRVDWRDAPYHLQRILDVLREAKGEYPAFEELKPVCERLLARTELEKAEALVAEDQAASVPLCSSCGQPLCSNCGCCCNVGCESCSCPQVALPAEELA